jgi:hypothetical protein
MSIRLAGLYDPGWWDMDFSKAERVVWANYTVLGLEWPLTIVNSDDVDSVLSE